MYHKRKTRKKYDAYPKPAACQFCDPAEITSRLVRETELAWVIKNRTFYDMWEMSKVLDHLMIVPKRHVASLSELTDAEKLDVMNLVGQYESTDYNIYARAVTNTRRSVAHQHTHLIKTDHKLARFLLHVRRPYFMIKL
jgi:diadenosine tetraphosphate (Ap4A) HIT family hydrolase